jgi:hypothetical protein
MIVVLALKAKTKSSLIKISKIKANYHGY